MAVIGFDPSPYPLTLTATANSKIICRTDRAAGAPSHVNTESPTQKPGQIEKKSMAQRKAGCENSGWNWMELVIIWVLKMEGHVIGKHRFSAGVWTKLFSNKLIRPSFLSS
jgi:hypothetical protein